MLVFSLQMLIDIFMSSVIAIGLVTLQHGRVLQGFGSVVWGYNCVWLKNPGDHCSFIMWSRVVRALHGNIRGASHSAFTSWCQLFKELAKHHSLHRQLIRKELIFKDRRGTHDQAHSAGIFIYSGTHIFKVDQASKGSRFTQPGWSLHQASSWQSPHGVER